MDDVEWSQRLKPRNCGHIFCGECVAGTLKAALDDKKVDDRLRCPDTLVAKPLDVLDVRACTYDRGDKATWAKYQEVATEALLDQANADEGNEKGLRRCPGDKCNHTFYYEPHATSGTLHICQKCHGAFCLGCRSSAARSALPTTATAPTSCSRRRRGRRTRRSTTSGADPRPTRNLTSRWRKERQTVPTKPPQCKQAITKNRREDQ